jgi:hypothetical protein
MANIDYPASPLFEPSAWEFGETRSIRTSPPSVWSDPQVLEVPYSHRWSCILTVRRARGFGERATVEAFFSRLRSGANNLLMHNHAHPEPHGTLRGNPTLANQHIQGANTLTINTTAGAMLLDGDMVGVTTTAVHPLQVVRVVGGGIANGAGQLVVQIEPPLRAIANAGAVVVWNRPRIMWRMVERTWRARYVAGEAEPMVLEFVETTLQ